MFFMISKVFSSIIDKLGFFVDNRSRDIILESSGMGLQFFLVFDIFEEDFRFQGVEVLDFQGVEDLDFQVLTEISFISDLGIEGNINRLLLWIIEVKQENLSKKVIIGKF